MVKPYLDDDSSDDIKKTPNVQRLLTLAEQEFIKSYGAFPTCAVYAPGCLTIAGKCTNLTESKSLSMAVQLVTLIVGKRSRDNKWCHVKTLSDEFAEENVCRFYPNDENLRISTEESSWVRYLKATIQCFKNKRGNKKKNSQCWLNQNLVKLSKNEGKSVLYTCYNSLKTDVCLEEKMFLLTTYKIHQNWYIDPILMHVPGFEIVIASTVPIKCGLGSSSALVVALYTFLEVITNTQTANVLEKTLVCQLAQKMATGSPDHRIVDSLISIIGNEDEIIAFDSRSLNISKQDWQTVNAEMVLIGFPEFDLEESAKYRSDTTRRKEILNIKNTIARWRTNPDGDKMMRRLYPEETMTLTENIRQEDKRISEIMKTIQTKRWKKLGKLLWENYRYTRKSLNYLPDEIERVMTALESTDGVLGASLISRGRGASMFALVQRSRFRSFISMLNRMEISKQRYYKLKSFAGATVLYTHERHVSSNDAEPRRCRQTLKTKYYLHDNDGLESENFNYIDASKSVSLFLTKDSFLTN